MLAIAHAGQRFLPASDTTVYIYQAVNNGKSKAGVRQEWVLPASWSDHAIGIASVTPGGVVSNQPPFRRSGRNLSLSVLPGVPIRLSKLPRQPAVSDVSDDVDIVAAAGAASGGQTQQVQTSGGEAVSFEPPCNASPWPGLDDGYPLGRTMPPLPGPWPPPGPPPPPPGPPAGPPGATVKIQAGSSSSIGNEFWFSVMYYDDLAPESRNSWACIGRAATLSMYHDYAIGVTPPPPTVESESESASDVVPHAGNYSYKTCGSNGVCLHLWHQTSVARTRGWHEFVISANKTAGVVWLIDGLQVLRKHLNLFLRQFVLENRTWPRQARNKHRENSTNTRCLAGWRRAVLGRGSCGGRGAAWPARFSTAEGRSAS
jgi:hypothetical protein